MANERNIGNMEFSAETSKEKFTFVPADCLVIFGRGIEKVDITRPEGGEVEVRWKPTRLVQELVKSPEVNLHVRTGRRKIGRPKASFAPDDEVKEMAGGGNANVLAALEWMELAEQAGQPPKEIIFSGGRPGYLQNEHSDLSEAKVMSDEFKRRAVLGKLEKIPPITYTTESRNTQDDLENSLLLAYKNGYKSAVIINVSWVEERVRVFYENYVLLRYPELAALRVEFAATERLLEARYGEKSEPLLKDLKESAAYKDTLTNEAIGAKLASEKKYGKGAKGKGNY